jgi:predicted DCC family thiol-disulfide oxidoreductase YuxK
MAGNTAPPRSVARPPLERPVLLFDGDCAFCRQWAERWRNSAGDRLDFVAAQTAGGRYPEIAPAEFERAVQLIGTDGRVFSGAGAIVRVRSIATHRSWLLAAYERVPLLAAAAEAVYRLVARHRPFLSGFTRLF